MSFSPSLSVLLSLSLSLSVWVEQSVALKMHAEDMSTLLSPHALQAADAREEHNDVKQLQLDQTDNIDGE